MSFNQSRSEANHDDIKHAHVTGGRIPSHSRPLRTIEWAVLSHLAIFVVVTTWCFGGGAEWLRPIFAWWGSLGLLITLVALQNRESWREGWMNSLVWLVPFLAFNALVLVALFNPSLREMKFDADIILVPNETLPFLPSSARPELSLHALWLFDAIWISCFNLTLVLRQRRAIRGLAMLLVINGLILAIFGTVQKLSGAKGLFFDAVPSPQTAFFSSFVYHNHWGSYIVLTLAACLGLIWHHARRAESRNFFHTPAFGGLTALFFMAATVPLSTSRSCSVLVSILLGMALLHWLFRLVQKRRRFQENIALPIVSVVAALAIGGAGVWYIAQDSIAIRVAKTREQIEEIRLRGDVGSRGELYRNTWQMARDRPWFGWGMASYPHVFRLYNTQKPADRLPIFYRDAHSDWLQSLAEHGFVGTILLGLCGIMPLLRLRRRHLASPVPCYLLAGCSLILIYAWIEFPFGNIAVVLTWWLSFFCAIHYARLYDRESAASINVVAASS